MRELEPFLFFPCVLPPLQPPPSPSLYAVGDLRGGFTISVREKGSACREPERSAFFFSHIIVYIIKYKLRGSKDSRKKMSLLSSGLVLPSPPLKFKLPPLPIPPNIPPIYGGDRGCIGGTGKEGKRESSFFFSLPLSPPPYPMRGDPMGRFVGSFFIFIYKNKKSTNRSTAQNKIIFFWVVERSFALTAKAPLTSSPATL